MTQPKPQVVAVMRAFNLDEKMYALRAHRSAAAAAGDAAEPLSAVAGMDALQLNIALKAFFNAACPSAQPLHPPETH